MALTYTDSATLMVDANFRGRIKVALLKYADYIFGEAAGTPAHNTRLRWAQSAYVSPDGVAATIAPLVVMDGAVQSAGASISDMDLQPAVEAAIQKSL